MFSNHKHILFFVFLLSICSSCKSKKLAQNVRPDANTIVTALSILNKHNLDFDWFSAKAKLKYVDPYNSESGTSFIRIKKDSVIWMTLKKYSVEGFRLAMTQDSIVILDRLAKQYSIFKWDEVSDMYQTDINYNKVENWIVGNIYLPEDRSTIDTRRDSSAYHFNTFDENNRYDYIVPFFLNNISDYIIREPSGREVHLHFDDCKREDDFCYFREYTIPVNTTENIYLRLEISDLEINTFKKTPFGIPPRYTRVH